MTNQEKKKWLNKYKEAEAEAERLELEIERLYTKAEKMTSVMKLIPAGGGNSRSLENAVFAIVEMADQLGEREVEALKIKRDIEAAIDGVESDKLRRVLRLRYIDGMKWDDIAETIGYDVDAKKIFSVHGRALSAIEIGH